MILHPPVENTIESSRYRRLWLNVLLRAREDAEGLDLVSGDVWKEIRREGKMWLTIRSGDLSLVCEMAGTSVIRVMEKFRRKYRGVS